MDAQAINDIVTTANAQALDWWSSVTGRPVQGPTIDPATTAAATQAQLGAAAASSNPTIAYALSDPWIVFGIAAIAVLALVLVLEK